MIESVSDLAGASADLKADLKNARRQKASTADALNLDRETPNAGKGEQAVLGCVMLSPMECLPVVIVKLKGDAEAFYDLRNQAIYLEMVAMFDAKLPIDLITLQQRLKDKGLLEQIGGIMYLCQLQDAVPSAANLSYYLDIVWDKYQMRRLVVTCSDIVGRVYDFTGDCNELMDECEREFMAIHSLRVSGSVLDTKTLIQKALDEIQISFDTQGEPSGLLTGFKRLDGMLDGLHGGEMIIIAARPGMGKSSLMMNFVEHLILEVKVPVGVFSVEMSGVSLLKRSLGSVARINIRKPWLLTQGEFARMSNAATRLNAAAPLLHVDDIGGLSILELRAKARRMVSQHGVRAIFIDYLQLLHGTTKKAKDNRQVEISEISSGIKALAKELNIPIVVLAQLNRELEKNKRKPRISDLRESGSIEQDADVIGLLSNELDDEDEPIVTENGAIKSCLEIAKQRSGPTGNVWLDFYKEFTKFEPAAFIDPADVPRNPHND